MDALSDRPLHAEDLDPDPQALFSRWFKEACEHGAFEPEAMALATSTPQGAPSVRMVLNKGFDQRGFVFFTNYGSRKGAELRANPRAALLFEREVQALQSRYGDKELPVKEGWGGYRLEPAAWEFWQHRPNRLHDRFRYLPRKDGGWRIERLGP